MIFVLRNNLLFGVFFAFVGLFLFCGMLYFAADTARFISDSVAASGRIVDYKEKDETDSNGKIVKNYYPVIEYSDRGGTLHRMTSDTVMNYEVFVFIKAGESGSRNPLFTVPEVKVMYRIDNPGSARSARGFTDLWGSALAYGIISAVFFIIGGVLLWFHFKRRSG
jgi:hypothetical protein